MRLIARVGPVYVGRPFGVTSAKVAIINCPEYIQLAGSSLILVLSMVSDFQKYWIRFSCYPGETEKFHDLHNLWKTGELRVQAWNLPNINKTTETTDL